MIMITQSDEVEGLSFKGTGNYCSPLYYQKVNFIKGSYDVPSDVLQIVLYSILSNIFTYLVIFHLQ